MLMWGLIPTISKLYLLESSGHLEGQNQRDPYQRGTYIYDEELPKREVGHYGLMALRYYSLGSTFRSGTR
jgi:hypothetical protein